MRAHSHHPQPGNPAATGFPPVPPEDSPQAGVTSDRADRAPQQGPSIDVRQAITGRIIAMLEQGGNLLRERWTRAASRGLPRNGKTGAQYHGANVLLLWEAAIAHSRASNVWMTYKQAASMGARVRRGEKGVMCAHFERVSSERRRDSSPPTATSTGCMPGGNAVGTTTGSRSAGVDPGTHANESADGSHETDHLICKPFWLFNIAQIDGLPADLVSACEPPKALTDRSPIEGAMRFIGGCAADIEHGFDIAAYSLRADKIIMPDVERFTSAQAYCATALHELVHWTGHPDRLARDFGKRFGDAAYAFEELVAELGSAFVLGHIGLVDATIEGHAAYLDAWLQLLRNDRSAIFSAAKLAGEAFEYILQRQLP